MNRLYSMVDKYMDWLNSPKSFFGFLIRGLSTIFPGIFLIGIIKGLQWISRPRKKPEPVDVDGERLVQDWRGFVIRQDEHRRMWGFEGYPATHDSNCTCRHCETTTTNYRNNTGYINFNESNPPTRRQVYDYLNNLHQGMVRHYSKGRERDFLPKKKIKAHKIVERKHLDFVRRPGVYIRGVDYSTMNTQTIRRNRDE